MSADRVERDLAELPDGGGPRAGWEGKVLATVRTDTARVAAMARPKQRQPLVFALAGGCAVALASILFFALRPDPELVRQKAAVEQLDQLVRDLEKAQLDFERAAKETDEKYRELLAAKTEQEKAAALAAMDRAKAAQMAKRDA